MNPASNPAETPMNGFQKYHEVKNSLMLFGFGVTLQLLSMYTGFLSGTKIKPIIVNRNSIT